MNLYSECVWDNWHRIVHIYPERCDSIPEYINDDATYKLIILERGILQIDYSDKQCEVKAPSLILLSQKDRISVRIMQKIKAEILYFKPSEIRDEFTFERIDSGEFEQTIGQNIFQDYILIQPFAKWADISDRVIPLSLNTLQRFKDLFTSAETELVSQRDGFWPCRSRSYMLEILHLFFNSFVVTDPGSDDKPDSSDSRLFSDITRYLNEHIENTITLETITREFIINRNKLNDIFMQNSSMTCMNYLLNLRMDLAKSLLSKTEIPISEISLRVGYNDANYFAKVFKKNTGTSPSKFRYS